MSDSRYNHTVDWDKLALYALISVGIYLYTKKDKKPEKSYITSAEVIKLISEFRDTKPERTKIVKVPVYKERVITEHDTIYKDRVVTNEKIDVAQGDSLVTKEVRKTEYVDSFRGGRAREIIYSYNNILKRDISFEVDSVSTTKTLILTKPKRRIFITGSGIFDLSMNPRGALMGVELINKDKWSAGISVGIDSRIPGSIREKGITELKIGIPITK